MQELRGNSVKIMNYDVRFYRLISRPWKLANFCTLAFNNSFTVEATFFNSEVDISNETKKKINLRKKSLSERYALGISKIFMRFESTNVPKTKALSGRGSIKTSTYSHTFYHKTTYEYIRKNESSFSTCLFPLSQLLRFVRIGHKKFTLLK